jgi:hypothetical protein
MEKFGGKIHGKFSRRRKAKSVWVERRSIL